MNRIICGVDVSKDNLDCRIVPGEAVGRFANTPAGIAALAVFCRQHQVELAVMEATGGYQHQAFLGLCAEGVAATCVNPGTVRHYAKGMGFLEKTDAIDAFVIASFGQARNLVAMPPPSKKQLRLNSLVKRLRQVTQDMTVNKKRLKQADDGEMRASIIEVMALQKKQTKTLEGEIASLIDDDPLWQAIGSALRSLKGVADRTVACILTNLPEIGTYDSRAIAKLTGLAPMANDSGKKNGPRHIQGGRSTVRSILYLVADIVRRYDPHIGAFHARLVAKGKPKMVIRIALAHKLLTILNARVRDARVKFQIAT